MYLIDIDNMSNKTIIKEQYKSADNLKLQKSLFGYRQGKRGGADRN